MLAKPFDYRSRDPIKRILLDTTNFPGSFHGTSNKQSNISWGKDLEKKKKLKKTSQKYPKRLGLNIGKDELH